MKALVLGLGLWLACASTTLWAEVVPDLYRQVELVLDQGPAERRRAVRAALERVLVRVSGHPRVLQQLAAAAPEQLVEAYRYESTDETLERDGEVQAASRLVLSFSRTGVDALLKRSGLPLWPANRPSVLVWLVRDDFRQGRRLVSLQEGGELAAEVLGRARQRGLPLISPLLDLEDRLSVSAAQLWRLDSEAILQASRRYRPDVVAVGRYSQTSSGTWLAVWSLWHKQQREVFDLEGENEPALVGAGIDQVASFLADQYAIVFAADSGGQVALQLDGVDSFAAYVAALDYLGGLDVVRRFELLAVENGRLHLRLDLAADLAALQSALDLDRRLLRLTPGSGDVNAAGQPLLRLRWPG